MANDYPENQKFKQAPAHTGTSYFRNIGVATKTLLQGLKLTWRHLLQARESRKPLGVEEQGYFDQQTGIITLQYPKESLPLPDNARYRLHNEIEDCIVCDKCAKICPVDCIEIAPIKAVETIGQTSDGTPKRLYAAKFDIDMAKCCFCGLCTTVCPTECLTMTKVYDFSEFDVADHTYAFSEMSPLEILQKKKELEVFQAQKEAQKAAKPAAKAAAPKPAMARLAGAKPAVQKPGTEAGGVQEKARSLMEQKKAAAALAQEAAVQPPNPRPKPAPGPEGEKRTEDTAAERPTLRPRVVVKPKLEGKSAPDEKPEITASGPEGKAAEKADNASSQRPRPVMKPVIKKTTTSPDAGTATNQPDSAVPQPKATPRPVVKPVVKKTAAPQPDASDSSSADKHESATKAAAKPRPVIKPLVRKAAAVDGAEPLNDQKPSDPASSAQQAAPEAGPPRPRPVVKPLIKKTGQGSKPTDSLPDAADESSKSVKSVIKPVIPKRPMQSEDTPEKREADEAAIKKPVPVVNKKEVIRKPPHNNQSADDQRQEDSQRPEPPGKPD